ncbi:cytochrome P450 [Mycolicibacterium elephantis]|uniref:Steroid C26-monooxygenase n=1 Tax=Mycolicibacterium elephantis TaxID=81858 RepID=A0A1A0R100_9MYCO|nr:cytochrome P450 [Mycolicibacterium elephantis]OBB28007.1 cytochrome [Mycolicibacterium elephantis]OBE96479.1 cytochrome [Mycolicibacterium elephantis]ORA65810.1 cytochrome P450 [Mycolicibacterium elephantis]
MTSSSELGRIDFTDLDNFANGFPHDLFAVHRREAPVYWHEPTEHTPDGEGFWSVATHAETLAVLRDPVTYSSVTGGDRPYGGTLLQDLSIAGQVLNMMDDPRHAEVRRLVSSGLTPRMIRRVEDDLRARARRLLDAVVPGEPLDFLVDIAAELPMQMICILLGVPESERHWLFHAIEPQFDFGQARRAELGQVGQMSAEEAGSRMYAYGQELIASKRAEPTDDMLSVVANATLDEGLSDLELYLFFSLLFSAGAETTRNAVAGGLLALIDHPDQFAALRADLDQLPTAVEEMVRWTSPSPSKRRTATCDTELAGIEISAGQKVQVWEGSANRDPAVFTEPDTFDITRKPNPHLGFGHGVHYCLGANLARLELRVLFEELLIRFSSARLVKPVEWTRSNRHTGIRHLVVELRG